MVGKEPTTYERGENLNPQGLLRENKNPADHRWIFIPNLEIIFD
jgi:hypothetical protein